MLNFRILFGFVPKTADYEASQSSLRKEYEELKAFLQSRELEEFREREKEVTSPEFAKRKKAILSRKYSDTPEFSKEKEYLKLKKKKEINRYFRIRDSVELKDFIEFDKSYDVKHYHTLEKLVHSEEFISQQKRLGKKKFKETEEYQKYLEFQALKKSERFRDYFKFKTSKDYVNFTLLIGSEKITAFENLERFVKSEEFLKVKEYMLLPPGKKLELSEEYKLEKQYLELKKSDKIQWYLKVKDSHKFDEIKRWQLTFDEEFDSDKLDGKRWLTRYFWGEVLLNDSYSLDHEKQYMNHDKNIEIAGSTLKIITKREKIKGKAWNPAIGFFPRDFEYTSGLVNSGSSFRQQYGLYEAKIRFNNSYPVHHACWLVSDMLLPHIDIAKASKKISMGNFWGSVAGKGKVSKNETRVSLSRYGSDFFIFSLEWNENQLTWKINGITVNTVREGIPKVPMFINISSSLYTDVKNSILPAQMEVDWIRCYKQVQPD
ncbi:MAG: glycoside hydrolase family 16 protein [Bacteroidales bacterium]|nr:glycoside hydrolase family 16 protein [Bacteroidales bacterium]